jgi:hypothetical protein
VGERNEDCSLGDLRLTACNVADTSTANLVVLEGRVVDHLVVILGLGSPYYNLPTSDKSGN